MGALEEVSDFLFHDPHNSDLAPHVDKAIQILNMIDQWSDAYPGDIFIPMTKSDWKDCSNILKAHGNRSSGAAAADCMRYVVTRMKETMERMS